MKLNVVCYANVCAHLFVGMPHTHTPTLTHTHKYLYTMPDSLSVALYYAPLYSQSTLFVYV